MIQNLTPAGACSVEALLNHGATTEDSAVVALFRANGAVPFCSTNVPQTLFTYDCDNAVYGETKNAVDPSRASGGSSGGEGALIGCRGSIFGIGGDVAGSIRTPAHYNGIAGFKPGSYLVSQQGSIGSIPGRPMIYGTAGPLGREVAALKAFCEVTAANDPIIHWPKPIASLDSLTVGLVLTWSGHGLGTGPRDPSAVCRQAVWVAKSILQRKGVKIVEWRIPEPQKLMELYYSACIIDGGKYLLKKLAADVPIESNLETAKFLSQPVWLQRLLLHVKAYFGDENAPIQLKYHKTTSELRKTYQEIGDYLTNFKTEFKQAGLDAILLPPMQYMAPKKHRHLVLEPIASSFAILANLLDAPAGVVPIFQGDWIETNGNGGIGSIFPQIGPQNFETETNVKNTEAQGVQDIKRGPQKLEMESQGPKTTSQKLDMGRQKFEPLRESPQEIEGKTPAGVQVMTLPQQERLCLTIMQAIEDGLKET